MHDAQAEGQEGVRKEDARKEGCDHVLPLQARPASDKESVCLVCGEELPPADHLASVPLKQGGQISKSACKFALK